LTILHDQEYFANSIDLPSKEFLKKCDAYMRGKGGSNGRSMPGTPYLNQSNGSQPRHAALMNSSVPERLPPPPASGGSFVAGSSNSSERNNMRGDLYPPPGSPPLNSQGVQQNQGIVQNMQRTSPTDDWLPTPPALPRPNRPSSPLSRPSSSSSRPSAEPNQQQQQSQGLPYNHPAAMNGYPSAAAAGGRQRL